MGKKTKKEKITYVDDGRTIADMSSVGRGGFRRNAGEKKDAPRLLPSKHSSLRAQAETYFAAVKMMLLPMLVVIGIISLAFLIVWLLL